ncbi:hypothetical protein HYH02_006291 [Chlamydomonas schloesseri]|uniref:Uncharacterized protein n=1 Tax=Chlamydomonas schloesseri TaxID=2026947 RepID=A0A835WJJ4_9CHLO|nr:hypothetical protein HYH02_006291 [Chlamydomonas schloesseri]|eukprot:KAG2448399.1 hypothetical protein HYH02_006291 [Chlamydomonas schloesseri]
MSQAEISLLDSFPYRKCAINAACDNTPYQLETVQSKTRGLGCDLCFVVKPRSAAQLAAATPPFCGGAPACSNTPTELRLPLQRTVDSTFVADTQLKLTPASDASRLTFHNLGTSSAYLAVDLDGLPQLTDGTGGSYSFCIWYTNGRDISAADEQSGTCSIASFGQQESMITSNVFDFTTSQMDRTMSEVIDKGDCTFQTPSNHYNVAVRYSFYTGAGSSGRSCCPICETSYSYSISQTPTCTVAPGAADPNCCALQIGTSSAYSTCYKSVSNADCINACTVGCTISSSNIGGFASKNPTGCCRCLTNSLGWCGCGSTVTYCCAY